MTNKARRVESYRVQASIKMRALFTPPQQYDLDA